MQESYYNIKDLENLSGIRAHTLRIWEQRYEILKPHRTDTNIRYYTNDDLKRILNISLLNRNGQKISKIATLSDKELCEQVNKLTTESEDHADQIESLIIAMIELDEERFEKIVNSAILRLGLIGTINDVLFPFLKKIGVMWQTGTINPAQEHFISNLIRQKIIVAIDGQLVKKDGKSKRVLFFLPEGELHEISLLFYTYIIRNKGHQSIYLGQTVPLNDMISVAEIRKPDYLVTVITQPLKDTTLEEYLKTLSKSFPKQTIFVSGSQVFDKKLPVFKNVTYFNTPVEFIESVSQI